MAGPLWQFGNVESWADTTPQPQQSHLMVTSIVVTLAALTAALAARRILKRRRALKEQRRWETEYWQKEREQCSRLAHRDIPGDPFARLNPKKLSSCYRFFNCTGDDPMGLVKEHYRELTHLYHPDASADRDPLVLARLEEKMNMINRAYQTILRARRADVETQGLHESWDDGQSP